MDLNHETVDGKLNVDLDTSKFGSWKQLESEENKSD